MNNTIKQIIEKAKSENRTLLTEIEAKQVFKEAGLQVTDTRLAVNKDHQDRAKTGGPENGNENPFRRE